LFLCTLASQATAKALKELEHKKRGKKKGKRGKVDGAIAP
jgi:hypothetical protein